MDPLDSALESLRGRRWPGDQHNTQLKDKLMQQFHTRPSSSRFGRHGALLTALALVVLAGVGFAAAGGVEIVRGWFMTVTVEVDGEVVTVEDVVLDEQGKATIALPPDALENGEELAFSISQGCAEGAAEGGTATIDIAVKDDVAEIQVVVEEDEGEE
jgi:hypothetical protein